MLAQEESDDEDLTSLKGATAAPYHNKALSINKTSSSCDIQEPDIIAGSTSDHMLKAGKSSSPVKKIPNYSVYDQKSANVDNLTQNYTKHTVIKSMMKSIGVDTMKDADNLETEIGSVGFNIKADGNDDLQSSLPSSCNGKTVYFGDKMRNEKSNQSSKMKMENTATFLGTFELTDGNIDKRYSTTNNLEHDSQTTQEQRPSNKIEIGTDKESIFQKIESYEDVRQESQEWYHVIQKHIILGNIDKVLEVMAQWIHTDRAKLHTHLIRFMAHLVLFFRSTRQGFRDDYVNVILEAYVDDLIQENNKSLVPHYIATLPPQLQILMCARFFEGITELGERQQCMELAREAGLDVQSIIKTVVENIRSHHIIDFSQNLEANIDTNITEDDKKKIESIDWLVFDPNQRSEALKQANAIMRAFVAVKKLTAAKEIFDKLPPDSIDVVFKVQLMQTGATDLSEEDENSIREFICHRAYLDAMDSFNDWFNTYHHTQPTKPTLSHGATFTEKVAHEHRIKQYEAEMERWRHNLISQTKTTKGKMYNVLLFADGGWMVDQKEEEEPDESRQQQMKLLRQLVLPGLCFLLHKTLHTSQQYAECLQLADVIASEQHLLYKVNKTLHTSQQYAECLQLADVIASEQHLLYKVNKTLHTSQQYAECLQLADVIASEQHLLYKLADVIASEQHLLYKVNKTLHTSQQYTECLQLADVIASEQHLLYKVNKTLHTSQQYAECLQLADVIASEQHLLYKVNKTLHTSQQYAECLQLADVIASEQHLLYKVNKTLHTSQQYAECLQLADVIASEQHLLYKVNKTLHTSQQYAECLQLGDVIASEQHLLYKVNKTLHTSQQYAECLQLADVIASEQHLLYKVNKTLHTSQQYAECLQLADVIASEQHLLYKVNKTLHTSQQYAECLQLADVIASEQHLLYKVNKTLHTSQQYAECLQLADVIASEQHLLYKVNKTLHTSQQYAECLQLADVIASEQHLLYKVNKTLHTSQQYAECLQLADVIASEQHLLYKVNKTLHTSQQYAECLQLADVIASEQHLLYKVNKTLHTSQQYAECLQLADVIASEQHLLYKVFRKDELQQLLKMLRDSALAVLDQNRDTLGYELD
ncbi:NUP107 [Mytilus edulis]|uniref:Nuclear pore complex protein n=1 Tax=Mytilus edulis TaxID=6550 RepID=A0A8S3RR54_MYTED|nr:NUP107 [Mytilus edulis]